MMKTELIRIYDPAEDAEGVLRAGDILARGGLVAIPTETVYGLAANAYDEAAVKAVYAAKGRPSDNPMIVHIAELSALPELVTAIPENAKILAEAFWPGPLTMVLPRSSKIPLTTTGGLETVAIRMPSHPVARAVIRAAGVPLAAPSANRSGSPSPTTFRHCVDDLWGLVDAIVESDDCTVGVESTVLCFLPDGTPQILRPGAVTPEEIQRRCGCVSVAEAVLHMLPQDAAAPSPGMKYKHYAPAATLTLLCGSREDYAARVNEYYETLQRAGEEDGFYAMCFDEDVTIIPPRHRTSLMCCGSWISCRPPRCMSTPRNRRKWALPSTTACCAPPLSGWSTSDYLLCPAAVGGTPAGQTACGGFGG